MRTLLATRSYYDLLNIDINASGADLRKAFRSAALRAHPDKEGGSKEAFHAIALAFEVLSCSTTRSIYDDLLQKSQGFVEVKTTHQSRAGANVLGASSRLAKPTKRHRKFSQSSCQFASKLAKNLGCLRLVLQSMSSSHREEAILNLTADLRLELKRYMEHLRHRKVVVDPGGVSRRLVRRSIDKADMTGSAFFENVRNYNIGKVYCHKGVTRIRYQANIHVHSLRLYTFEQSDFETAVDHQIILVQLKNALNMGSLKDGGFWENPKNALSVCEAVLRANDTTEARIGLRAWVHMRAPRWLHHRYRIASAATTLAHALEFHRRLLRARECSWIELRSEWLALMQGGRKRLSSQQAELIADRARHETLKEQFSRAVKNVQRMLDERKRKRVVTRVNVQRKKSP